MTDSTTVPVIIQGDDEIETHILSAVDVETVKQEEALGKQIKKKGGRNGTKKRSLSSSRRSAVDKAAELGLTEEKATLATTTTVKRSAASRVIRVSRRNYEAKLQEQLQKQKQQQEQQQQQKKGGEQGMSEDVEHHYTLLRSNSNEASSGTTSQQHGRKQSRRQRQQNADEAASDEDDQDEVDEDSVVEDKENNTGRLIFGFKKQHGKSMQSMMKKAMEEQQETATTTSTTTRKGSKRSTVKQSVDHGKRRRIQRQIELLKDDRQSDDDNDDEEKEEEESEDDDEEDTGAVGGTEGYFQALHGKSQTSNNTMSKLPVLEPQEFHDILETMAPAKHADDIATLLSMHKLHFNEWFFKLHAGFNLLFYGYGSKRRLVNDFVQSSLTDGVVLMINGFFPSITVKTSLSKLVVDALDVTASPPAQMQDLVALITNYFVDENRSYKRLYLIVHNIDGSTLRNERSQQALSMLADTPNIHLIATIDHINAGLLWDNVKTSRFNWLWHDATTFDDYLVETSFENSLLMRSGELGGARGIQYVLRSLTSNGRGVFRVLAEHQLMEMEMEGNDTAKANESMGLPYHRYYDGCRESFLVSNDMQLRSLLTEFIDHKIIHAKRSADGTEVFYIPLDKSTLCNILEEISE